MKSPPKTPHVRAVLGALLICLVLAAGCSTVIPSRDGANAIEAGEELISQAAEMEDTDPAAPSSAPDVNADKPEDCQVLFEERELREPYQRQDGDQARYTLSADDLQDYLDLMGIKSICLPAEFGAPFINVDWDEAEMPASGRMVSLGFENLYQGAGWSSAYLLYSTYDFELGTEYEVFGGEGDLKQLETGAVSDIINAGNSQGFVRYHAGIPMGMQMIMKTYVFPFENHYVAAVINLGAFEPSDREAIIAELEKGDHSSLSKEDVLVMDDLVSSLIFEP